MTQPAVNTPYGIITDAYQDAGLLPDEQTPNSEQLAKGMRRLRDLINLWQTQGLKLWVNTLTQVPLVAAQMEYSLGSGGDVDMTKPLRVLEAYYLRTEGSIRRPLTQISWNDYMKLGSAGTDEENQGPITQFLVKKEATSLKVIFWPCPNTDEADDGAVYLLLQTQITNPSSLTETMQFPEEWRMALRWGLAADLCTGQPDSIVARCDQRAESFRVALENWDVEDAPTQFQVDSRAAHGYNPGSFR